MAFSDQIKLLRKELKLTQIEFGERLAVSRSVVKNWEYGSVEPTEMAVRHICNTFHISEQWLRTGEGEMYEETAETIFDQLAAEYDLGPAGRLIVDTALKMYRIGGEQAFVDMIQELLPVMQDIVQQAEARKFSGGAAEQETQPEQSGIK